MSSIIQPARPEILVVEDEVIVRMDLVELIEDSGFTVHEAGNADEALKVLEARPNIGAMITDIDMPGSMNGLKLSHCVKDRWPPIKIIVASSHVHIEKDDLPDEGVFLDKPYNTPRICALLTNIVHLAQAC